MRHFTREVAAALSLGVLACQAAACAPDLGACDSMRARRAAFVSEPKAGDPDARDSTGIVGQPMFEGQALIASSCGSGECHSSVADGAPRNGVPGGFDFDIGIACDERTGAAGCDPAQLGRLRLGRNTVYDRRHGIYESVLDGTMPPREQAKAVRDQAPSFVRDDGTPLPGIDTPDGREILRNWLACRTPVVERAEDIRPPRAQGDYCGDGLSGDCVYTTPRVVDVPDPSWPSIYAGVLVPLCVGCHAAGPRDYRVESQIDLSTADVAYDQLVGVTSIGAFCKNRGLTHIVAGDAAGSFFLAKLGDSPVCGVRMPLGGPYLPEEVLVPIRAWIDAGAARE